MMIWEPIENFCQKIEKRALWKRKHRQHKNGDASGGREWPSTTLSLGKPCGLTNTTIDAEFLSLGCW